MHRTIAGAALLLLCSATASAATPSHRAPAAGVRAQKMAHLAPHTAIDHSGRALKGRASYYAHQFANRTMADGNRFNAHSDAAASKILPLGTTAKVTNLENGKSAIVQVEDRGAYRAGRVLDVAPSVADRLDMKHAGVAPVMVAPIAVPQPDGTVKLGAGAAEASPQQLETATRLARATTR